MFSILHLLPIGVLLALGAGVVALTVRETRRASLQNLETCDTNPDPLRHMTERFGHM